MNLNKMIDHTVLNPDAKKEDILRICKEAKEFDFATVCINPYWIPVAKEALKGCEVGITTVIGFPLGANATETKVFETKKAIEDGADEIDMVLNVGALKSGDESSVLEDIRLVKEAAGEKVLKVILETCLLTKEEIVRASELAKEAGADFVKTSTGFSTGGATVEDVKKMRETVGEEMGVKASGGIRNFETANQMIEAGASRIGASKSIEIVKGSKE
ncbi:deoxyribose-phosphate aldolase [Peptoniphilus sp. KCTC 25270]|uniref:deoxyribose-phosphate aldolase n=1 Tax=Peptoniphilus sp. KCTC 25270 TaxID=2897414 RepID=UPI001E2A002D|nr:deoxyribose-phosphate aldolase [Peptoniphilus sp. KCTC 25270]MCD1147196.1 deoxyribose-phosphate aldolase [Peptoniphilus sp. KCTC 25270]